MMKKMEDLRLPDGTPMVGPKTFEVIRMMKKLVPVADRIVVRRCDPESMTEGGIAIPESAQKKSLRVEVLAIGPGRFVPERGSVIPVSEILGVNIEPGMIVVIGNYSGYEMADFGKDKDIVILRPEDIQSVECDA